MNMPEQVNQMVTDRLREYHRDLDKVCMSALMTSCGVLVTWTDVGAYTIEVSEAVPYGEIHTRMEQRCRNSPTPR